MLSRNNHCEIALAMAAIALLVVAVMDIAMAQNRGFQEGRFYADSLDLDVASAALDFPATLPGTTSDLTMTAAGVADGDPLALGVPSSAVVANGGYSAWCSDTDEVTIRFENLDLVATLDPPSGTFRVVVLK